MTPITDKEKADKAVVPGAKESADTSIAPSTEASVEAAIDPKANLPHLQHIPLRSIWVMICSVCCFMCFYLVMNCTNVFGTLIRDYFSISATELSLLGTATMLTFCVGPMIIAKYAHKIGIKLYVTLALTVNIIGGLLLFIPFFGDNYWGYMFTRLLAGCAGVINGPLPAQLSLWFPKNGRGFATGICVGAIGLGFTVTAALSTPLLNLGLTWLQATIVLSIVPSAVMIVVYNLTVKDFSTMYPGAESIDDLLPAKDESKRSTRFDDIPKPKTNREVWTNKRIWSAAIFVATTGVLVYGLGYTLPLYFQDDLGLSLAESSAIIAATFIWKEVASPAGGFMSDVIFKGERFQTCIIGNLFGGIMMFVTVFAANIIGIGLGGITVLIIITFFLVSLYGGCFKCFPYELAAPEAIYAASGMLVGVANIGSLITTPICGFLIDTTGTATSAMIFMGIVCFIGVFFAYHIKD